MRRLFVALALPEVVSDSLSQLQFGLDGARWIDPEYFHLTLTFIGETDRHGHEEAISALSGVSAPGFELTLSACGYFGDRKPRALWVGVEPSPALVHLQSKVENALRRAGFALGQRRFSPHVTIAYLKGTSQPAVEIFAAQHGAFRCGPFPVDAFHLFESTLGGEGAHYEIDASYQLSSSR